MINPIFVSALKKRMRRSLPEVDDDDELGTIEVVAMI